MKNQTRESIVSKVIQIGTKLDIVSQDVVKLTNYKNSLETLIIDFCELYDIKNEELIGLEIKEVPSQQNVLLKKIFNSVPNAYSTLAESVIVAIDLKETEENLRFSGEFQEPIIKNIIKQLEKLTEKTVKKVVVK